MIGGVLVEPRVGASPKAIFYCDESGYTGTDWANPDQPVFVHGGWLVLESRVDEVRRALARVKERLRIQSVDLKYQQLAKRPNPDQAFLEFFLAAKSAAAVPCFQLVDKQYFIATKVIETFFDPMYNHHLPIEFTSNFTAKAKLAEKILDAPEILLEFAKWLNRGGPLQRSEVRDVGLALASHLRANGRKLAAGMLVDFTDDEIDDIRSEFDGEHWTRSLTGHTLIAVLQHVERVVRDGSVSVEIVHDTITNFEELLEMARGLFRDGGHAALPGEDVGNRVVTLPTATGLRLANSQDEDLLQAADLLCGYMRDVVTRVRSGAQTTESDRVIARHLMGLGLLVDCWGFNAPEALVQSYVLLAAPLSTDDADDPPF